MFVKTLLLIVFFASMIGVGFYARRKSTDVNGFVLGGRTVGPWLTAFAYGTSYFSAVVFIGYAGQFGWKYGISTTWVGLGNAFIGSLLAWVLMGRRTRIMTQHLDAKTMPEYFGKRYDSKALRIIASVIAFVFLIPYTASVYKGLSTLFGLAFSIDYKWCVIVMAFLTAVYVILGGYMATAINDFIQGIIMLGGIIAVIAAVLHGKGGFLAALNQLSQIPVDPANTTPALMGMTGPFTSFFGPDPLNLFGVVVLTSLGTWGLPQMVGKFYAIKSEQAVKTGTVVSTAFAVIIAGGCYFLGGFGRLFDVPAIYGANGKILFDNIVPTMLSTLPDVLIGIVIVLVLSASMSTLSSLVLTSSSTLTLDVIKETACKNLEEKKTVLVMRVLVVFFIVISVVIALNPPTFIAQLMGISWGALAGAFLAPFLYGLFSKKVSKAAVWVCFIYGVGITVANIYLKFMNPINCGAVAMVGGLVLVPLVSLVTPKMQASFVDKIFTCYDEKVEVEQKMYLKEEN
ncbi:MAG: sodium/solute symporter [Treponemataceae bacterium]|nr:sodium/solute symporter [Treponemataceae bacterium]